jgi:hypothetical protein
MRVRGRELVGAEHPQHHACFGCRKAFKQRGSTHPSWSWITVPDRPFPCPVCKVPMAALGRDFAAPPQRARAQWLKVELLHSFGVAFEVPVYDSGGPGPRPVTLGAAVGFLAARGFDPAEVRRRLAVLRRLRAGAAPDAEPGAAADGPSKPGPPLSLVVRRRRASQP